MRVGQPKDESAEGLRVLEGVGGVKAKGRAEERWGVNSVGVARQKRREGFVCGMASA